MAVYNACVISTILYGSEAWTTYSKQERKLNSFHLQSLRCILGISWRDKVPNTVVLGTTTQEGSNLAFAEGGRVLASSFR